eukprot:TRINITY_DN245_c0_g1_i3.p1 TRINITY_DN245_c0_g1~~TRINITY_DN245_c0_g1_i3.p1  ORF type:complete len:1139 (+),score=282.29 TRINITY_DN245_c0_g1_i3:126-3542(+)
MLATRSPESGPRRPSIAPPNSVLSGGGSFRGVPKRNSLKRRGSARQPAAPPPPSPPPPEPPLYKLTAAQLRECEKVFHASGGVRPDNLSRILSQLNLQSHATAVEHFWKERLASGAPHAGYLKFEEFVDLVTDMLIQRLQRGSQRDAAALEAFVAMGGGPDGEGTVDAATLRDACEFFALGVDLEKLTAADASGQLSFARFKALLEEDIEPGVKEAFLRFGGKDNADGIYEIPTEVLIARSIEAGMDEGEVIRFVNTVDSDASGTVEMGEFQALLRVMGINPGDMNTRTLPELAALRWGGEQRRRSRAKVAASEKVRGDAARSRTPATQPAAAPGGSSGTQSQMQWGYKPQTTPASEIERILQRLSHMPSPDVALPTRNVSPVHQQSRHGAEMSAGNPAAGRPRMVFKPPRPPLRVPLSRSPSPAASPTSSRKPAGTAPPPRPPTRPAQQRGTGVHRHHAARPATAPTMDAALAAKLFQVRTASQKLAKCPPLTLVAAPVDPRFRPGDLVIVEPPPGAAESQPADSDAPPPGTRMVVVGPGDAPGTLAVRPETPAAQGDGHREEDRGAEGEGGAAEGAAADAAEGVAERGAEQAAEGTADGNTAGTDGPATSAGGDAAGGGAAEGGECEQAESAPEGGAAEAAKGVRSIATSHLRHASPEEKAGGAAGAGDGAAAGKGGFEGLCLRILLQPKRDPWERAGSSLLPPPPPRPPGSAPAGCRRPASRPSPYRVPPVSMPDPSAATAPPQKGPSGSGGWKPTVPYRQYSAVVRQCSELRERVAYLEEREKQYMKEQKEQRRAAAKPAGPAGAAAQEADPKPAAAADGEDAREESRAPWRPTGRRVGDSGGGGPLRAGGPHQRASPPRKPPKGKPAPAPSEAPAEQQAEAPAAASPEPEPGAEEAPDKADRAATKIQAAQRRRSAQREARKRREKKASAEKKHKAATRIQTAQRRRSAQHAAQRKRAQKEAPREGAAEQDADADQMEKAATKIQAAQRRRSAVEVVKQKKKQKATEEAAATRIQAAQRRRSATQIAKKKKAEKKVDAEKKNAAATKVQSQVRGRNARKEAERRKSQKEDPPEAPAGGEQSPPEAPAGGEPAGGEQSPPAAAPQEGSPADEPQEDAGAPAQDSEPPLPGGFGS